MAANAPAAGAPSTVESKGAPLTAEDPELTERLFTAESLLRVKTAQGECRGLSEKGAMSVR